MIDFYYSFLFNSELFNFSASTYSRTFNNDIMVWKCNISISYFDKINMNIRCTSAMKYTCYNRLPINNGQRIGAIKLSLCR